MNNKILKEKGVTLVALTIYMLIFTIIIGILTTISTFFYNNIGEVIDNPKYVSEFNKFVMFFAVDIKNYNSAIVTDNILIINDNIIYKYENNEIYRNDTLIAKNIMNCEFTIQPYNVNSITKNIINVDIKIGKNNSDFFEKSIDFTMKYW